MDGTMKGTMPLQLEFRSDEQPRLEAATAVEEAELIIRALNSDNHREAEKLVELLLGYYGSGQPFDGIYDPEYWCSQVQDLEAESDTISIVAEDGQRYAAHVALRKEESSECYELLLPAIHPYYRNDLFAISRLFWQKISALARRQNWRMVYQYSSTSESALQIISAKCFQSYEMALLPDPSWGYVASGKMPVLHKRNSLLLMFHLFPRAGDSPVHLYPPAKHARKVRELFAPLPLKRVIVESGSRMAVKPQPSPVDPEALSRELSLSQIERLNLHLLTFEPSALAEQEGVLAFIEDIAARVEARKHRLCVRLALDDPRCPSFSEAIESIGLHFCGVFPADGHDYMLFSKFDPSALREIALYTPRARALKDYILASV